jgi:hypothetical protein
MEGFKIMTRPSAKTSVVTEWILNPDKYITELNNAGKEERKYMRALKARELLQQNMGKSDEQIVKGLTKKARATRQATKAAQDHQSSSKGLMQTFTDYKSSLDVAIGATKAMYHAFDELSTRANTMNKLQAANVISINKAKAATQGYISDMELLKAANQAATFGMKLTDEQFASMAKNAAIMAQTLGGDVNKAIGDLITGMGRQSRLILDNLGLIIDSESAYSTYAATLNKSVKELTDAEKKTAFMNATLEQLEKKSKGAELSVNSAADSFVTLKTAMDNTLNAFAKMLASSSALGKAFNYLKNVTREYAWAFGQLTGKQSEFQQIVKKLKDSGYDIHGNYIAKGFTPGVMPHTEAKKLAARLVAIRGENKALAEKNKILKEQAALERELAKPQFLDFMGGVTPEEQKAQEENYKKMLRSKGGRGRRGRRGRRGGGVDLGSAFDWQKGDLTETPESMASGLVGIAGSDRAAEEFERFAERIHEATGSYTESMTEIQNVNKATQQTMDDLVVNGMTQLGIGVFDLVEDLILDLDL